MTAAMRTVGVDLSASPAKTAVAVLDWFDDRTELVDLVVGADDAEIRRLVDGATRIGIDSPFGWPDDFVEFVVAHHRGGLVPGRKLDDIANRRPLALRRTDRWIAESGLGRPLSVSADQIAHVAFRCAGLLADLGVEDRVEGWAVEAYPAGALKRWGLTSRGYKRAADRTVLTELVDALRTAAPWLELGERIGQMRSDDDAFDAVITALIARAAELGSTTLPSPDDRPVALREGWIHVPDGELDTLTPTTSASARVGIRSVPSRCRRPW
ncbi:MULTISPECIES: DUF429 domain-containing protein [Gordonia]|uniref:DUF429 domain-containing protein n=3 Tax=Gordonia TaxID=2053 RepID=F9W2C8_9ACTN|nr:MULTISPECIES: DUF429 domain-containing protein [Gordonia]AZZ80532.1 DUF429 domain-containing protein [Gordonia alkanivorans]ETA08126.1 hypothetical protein V525_04280 [Gordonia alkanivorans CGMCC 6845]MDH3011431.1 DUF429 domain-containing protein [Gordonia alkanivorans]MDH3026917.1 DUF429 domain-containing protein [Gordonia alkanivorans]MDH3049722.1 DUF429 domain-containing protein [Gordonia alkanivorans]